ncbi:hypothetical protein JOC78_002211 [Bacillus ectoiniformans]|nr:hypothetical protein [Bacillus ectoiniformans]MBM7649258.1 hypothetical protein [Bacillus ectoiniformans]
MIPEQVVATGKSVDQLPFDYAFSDADGDPLTYTVESSDTRVVQASIQNNKLNISSGSEIGLATVTITASDRKGGTAAMQVPVRSVQLVHSEKITTKWGVWQLSYDLSKYMPNQLSFTVFKQSPGQEGSVRADPLYGNKFTIYDPGSKNYWIVGEDHKAVYLELTRIDQQRMAPFISEVLHGSEDRMAVEIYHPIDGTTGYAEGYELEIHRWFSASGRKEIATLSILNLEKGATYHLISSTFYDFFNITGASYINKEFYLTGDGITTTALVLKKNGQVIDVVGNPDSSHQQGILLNGGTIVRKYGILSGSDSFQLIGEWDQYPRDTYQFFGEHQP